MLCFDINSNFYFQNNQVLTQIKIKQKLRERERERESTCNRDLKNTTPKHMDPK